MGYDRLGVVQLVVENFCILLYSTEAQGTDTYQVTHVGTLRVSSVVTCSLFKLYSLLIFRFSHFTDDRKILHT